MYGLIIHDAVLLLGCGIAEILLNLFISHINLKLISSALICLWKMRIFQQLVQNLKKIFFFACTITSIYKYNQALSV